MHTVWLSTVLVESCAHRIPGDVVVWVTLYSSRVFLLVFVGPHIGFRMDASVFCMVFVGSDASRIGCFTLALPTDVDFAFLHGLMESHAHRVACDADLLGSYLGIWVSGSVCTWTWSVLLLAGYAFP